MDTHYNTNKPQEHYAWWNKQTQKTMYSIIPFIWLSRESKSVETESSLVGALGWGGASLVAQKVKNPPAMQETWVQTLGWEDPLEKGTAIHPSILAWRIPMDRGAWQATVHEVAKSWTQLSDFHFHFGAGERNGEWLQMGTKFLFEETEMI